MGVRVPPGAPLLGLINDWGEGRHDFRSTALVIRDSEEPWRGVLAGAGADGSIPVCATSLLGDYFVSIVQWTGQQSSKLRMRVRFLLETPSLLP